MDTPIVDFVSAYIQKETVRAHMPGHKGMELLGCESRDITEIYGADSLYEAQGIIRQSEDNAARIFGAGRTCYSAEGSSLCIRAMLYLIKKSAPRRRAKVLAARGVHKTFIQAAAALDIDVDWLWPEGGEFLPCRSQADSGMLEEFLKEHHPAPDAVYVTSPDYLGNMSDIKSLADTAHRYGVPLLVDNAHGAYLKFLDPDCHPISAGADICCDSAHKTLPVLTGGAYLHISKDTGFGFAQGAKEAMSFFGSTSPSYIILQSLDGVNPLLENGYREKIAYFTEKLSMLKAGMVKSGWDVCPSDPLRLTVDPRSRGYTGTGLAEELRNRGIECEYSDPEYLVMMLTPCNGRRDIDRIENAIAGVPVLPAVQRKSFSLTIPGRAMSIRQAVLAESCLTAVEDSVGKIAAEPAVSCPPAVPVAVSGEIITARAAEVMKHYGIDRIKTVVNE